MPRRLISAITAAVVAYMLDGDIAKYVDASKKVHAVRPVFCEAFTPCVVIPPRGRREHIGGA